MQFPEKDEAAVRWLQKDEATFHMDDMEVRDRWQYYVSSWARNEPTEGVPRSRMQKAMLTRNFPSGDAESDGELRHKPIVSHESLGLKICINTSKIVYDEGFNCAIYKLKEGGPEKAAKRRKVAEEGLEVRNQKYVEKMGMNSPWMKNLSQEAVQQAKEDYRKWEVEGNPPAQPIDEDWTMVHAPVDRM